MSIGTLAARLRSLGRDYAAALYIAQRVRNYERVATDALNLIFIEIGRVAIAYHARHNGGLYILLEHEHLLGTLIPQPLSDRISPVPNLFIDLLGNFDISQCAMMEEPIPELWDHVEGIVVPCRVDENVCVEEVEHRVLL
jgi:hypothetical protein